MRKELNDIPELTKAELQIMCIVWEREQVFVKDVIAVMSDPKPAYTTVSTILKILLNKKFVSYRVFGKNYQYYPLVSKTEYLTKYLKQIELDFFDGSIRNLLSFLISNCDLSDDNREEMINLLQNE